MSESSINRLQENIGEKIISIETGRMAKQAHGSVLVRMGDTVMLSTAVASKNPKPGHLDFVPLSVDYKERTYAAGKIPGGFFKREGRAREKEILASRLSDRSIRPLFPEGFNHEAQVVSLVVSSDLENDADILSITGASAALMLSSIPFNGPVAAIRLGMTEGKFIINPTFAEREASELDLVISGTSKGILMVEGGGKEISDSLLISAMETAKTEIDKLCRMQEELRKKAGRPKFELVPYKIEPEIRLAVENSAKPAIEALLAAFPPKEKISETLDALKKKLVEQFVEKFPDCETGIKIVLEETLYYASRSLVLDRGVRVDGRKCDEIRRITIDSGVLPRTHGSALFTRGQTQSLVTVTLGTPADMQIMDELEGRFKERFLLHYNFPGFATGEVKPDRGASRREVGHGALAKRSLAPLLPSEEDFPYTLRIVSEILESNGSSSMASVCGGSLALFDAGVPLKAACAGIAMGLITDGKRHSVISDILGMEDHLGDMDFKLAGTRKGITAFQMDVKIDGVPVEILKEAIAQASRGRNHILDLMEKSFPAPKTDISVYAPRMVKMSIPQDKIGAFIGPGGKNIRRIIEETGADINVEDDGSVFISGVDADGVKAACKMVEYFTAEVAIGQVYTGRVVSIVEFGAFVEVLPGKEGLLHISEIAPTRIRKVEDVLKMGEEVEVKVIDMDNTGRFKLSRKALLKTGAT
ncbi:MAG: polyribonucleotide nucleotidyltransferase [bacterium]